MDKCEGTVGFNQNESNMNGNGKISRIPADCKQVNDENKADEDDDESGDSQFKMTKKQRMTLKLNDETIEAIKDVFRDLDKDGSGTLDVSELGNAMMSMGVNCGEHEIEAFMKQADEDGNGTMDFFQFAHMVSTKLTEYDPETELREAFSVFDKNGDGKISVDELKAVVESLGGAMTEADLENMLLEADDNNDGFLDYSEFVRIWLDDDTPKSKNMAEEEESADL